MLHEKNDDEVAAFLADIRATHLSDVDEVSAARQLDAFAKEAREVLERGDPEPDWWRKSIRNRFLPRD